MKLKHLLLSLAFLILVSGCGKDSSTSPEIVSALSISPSQTDISVGDDVNLTIQAADVTRPVFAVSMRLSYNSSTVEFQEAQAVASPGFFADDAIIFAQTDTSFIYLSITQIQGDEMASGNGEILELLFSGINGGDCNLSILPEYLYFYDSAGEEIEISPLHLSDGLIRVNIP